MLLLENVSVLTKENRFRSFYIIPGGALFHEGVYEELAKKYANVKDKLLPDRGKSYQFHFTQEDFYVFVLAHAHKHCSHSGTGIRILTDLYVMNRKIGTPVCSPLSGSGGCATELLPTEKEFGRSFLP